MEEKRVVQIENIFRHMGETLNPTTLLSGQNVSFPICVFIESFGNV